MVWLLMLALFVRSVIPVGYMPDAHHTGNVAFTVKICTGSTSGNEIGFANGVSGKHDKNHKDNSTADSHPCVFNFGALASFDGLFGTTLVVLAFFILSLTRLRQFMPQMRRVFCNASPRALKPE